MDMLDDFSMFGMNPPIGYSVFNFGDYAIDSSIEDEDDLPLYDF